MNKPKIDLSEDRLFPMGWGLIFRAGQLAEDIAQALDAWRPEWREIIAEIAAERDRQISAEGWDTEHDDAHTRGELARAAMGYCQSASTLRPDTRVLAQTPPTYWPWAAEWWNPKTPRRDLIRAAALIVAEIERLGRLTPGKPPEDAGEK